LIAVSSSSDRSLFFCDAYSDCVGFAREPVFVATTPAPDR